MGAKSGKNKLVNDEMRLLVWGTGWGLPSIDPESLQLIAYIKFSGAPVLIVKCENPWKSPTGKLPFFQHGTTVLYSLSDVAVYLRQRNYSCDFGLSPKQTAEVIAYTHYVTEALCPALNYYCWVHDGNYGSVIRPCYTKRLPWLYKFWHTDRRRREAQRQILTVYPLHEIESAEPDILESASYCISLLSDKLGNQEFFQYPNHPSILDAVLVSYLAPFTKIPLPHSPLKDQVRLTPNLERFIGRVLQRYHSKSRGAAAAGGAAVDSDYTYGLDGHPVPKKFDDVPFPVYQKVLAIAVGAGVMFAFAYHNGMINLTFVESVD